MEALLFTLLSCLAWLGQEEGFGIYDFLLGARQTAIETILFAKSQRMGISGRCQGSPNPSCEYESLTSQL